MTSIQINGLRYTFKGPVTPSRLPSASGVYMIAGRNKAVYIGESGDINGRVNGKHERKPCWLRHCTGNSVYYALEPHPGRRLNLEEAAIKKWDPVCNRT